MGSNFNLPVLYFTQVMGLAYGYSPKELGMDKISVSADHLIRRVTKEEYEKQKAEEAAAKKGPESESKGSNRNSRKKQQLKET